MLKALALAGALGALALSGNPAFAANSPDYLVEGCRSSLDAMRTIVRKETVAAVGKDARISVIPFCMGIQFNDFGNAAGLGVAIGKNPTLARALARNGWRSDDVTSIVIDGNRVRLYVHRD